MADGWTNVKVLTGLLHDLYRWGNAEPADPSRECGAEVWPASMSGRKGKFLTMPFMCPVKRPLTESDPWSMWPNTVNTGSS